MNILRHRLLFQLILVVFGALLGAGTVYFALKDAPCKPDYAYLNPVLDCSEKMVISKQAYVTFIKDLSDYISQQQAAGNVGSVSVFFRDLQLGPTFSINASADFVPASLLKLPVLLTYLALAEDNLTILNQTLVFEKTEEEQATASAQYYSPKKGLSRGASYTIEDLLLRMIAYSDNDAYLMLVKHLSDLSPGEDLLLQTHRELGIIYPTSSLEQTLTVKSYASIFRLLYNASYLSQQLSEKAITMMIQEDFESGIPSGVPKGIAVAHKFGERSIMGTEGHRQLHDCGIVYYPKNPYLLCIMTRGNDFDALAQVIGTISQKMYAEVDSRRIVTE